NSLVQQVRAASLGVGKEHVARMVDDAAIHLFGDPIVEAAVASFHVVHRHAKSLRNDSRKPAVRFTQKQQAIRPDVTNRSLDARENLPSLFAKRLGTDAERDVGRTNLEVAEKHIDSRRVEV